MDVSSVWVIVDDAEDDVVSTIVTVGVELVEIV